MVSISIVVPTFNRADLLKGCLESLVNQSTSKELYEIVVVDNNSTDGTELIVNDFLFLPNFKYVKEEEIGLSKARNRGVEETIGEYVAYFDDDVIVDHCWIENALSLIRNDTNLDGLGGPCFPFYTTPKPDWFEDKYSTQLGKSYQYFLNPGQAFIGGNMIWKRETLQLIGNFDPDFGPVGNSKYMFGEETHAYIKAWEKKPSARFLYSPTLIVKHWVHPHKMLLTYRLKRYFFSGFVNSQISSCKSFKGKVSSVFHKSTVLVKRIAKSLINIRKYSKWQKWVFSEGAPIASCLGGIFGAIGIFPSKRW